MNLNNCHNCVIGRNKKSSLGRRRLAGLLVLLLLLVLSVPACRQTRDKGQSSSPAPALTAPDNKRDREPAPLLSGDQPLTPEEAEALASRLDLPLETYDLLRPGGAADLTSMKESTVLRVVDGDTLIVEWEDRPTRLRLIGIDAPESHSHHEESLRTDLGESVSRVATAWLEDRPIYLQFDQEHLDPYERLLAYVWLDSHTMVNEVLVREGLVWQHRYPPNTHFNDYFESLEEKARGEARGIWRTG